MPQEFMLNGLISGKDAREGGLAKSEAGCGIALTRTIAVIGIEASYQTTAINVEGFKDLQDGIARHAPDMSPDDNVEVFFAFFKSVEDAIEEEGVIVEVSLQDSEVTAVEFDPEAFALQMFQPAGTQVAPPMTLNPALDGRLTQVAACPFALNPFIAQRFLLAFKVNAEFFHGKLPPGRPPQRESSDLALA